MPIIADSHSSESDTDTDTEQATTAHYSYISPSVYTVTRSLGDRRRAQLGLPPLLVELLVLRVCPTTTHRRLYTLQHVSHLSPFNIPFNDRRSTSARNRTVASVPFHFGASSRRPTSACHRVYLLCPIAATVYTSLHLFTPSCLSTFRRTSHRHTQHLNKDGFPLDHGPRILTVFSHLVSISKLLPHIPKALYTIRDSITIFTTTTTTTTVTATTTVPLPLPPPYRYRYRTTASVSANSDHNYRYRYRTTASVSANSDHNYRYRYRTTTSVSANSDHHYRYHHRYRYRTTTPETIFIDLMNNDILPALDYAFAILDAERGSLSLIPSDGSYSILSDQTSNSFTSTPHMPSSPTGSSVCPQVTLDPNELSRTLTHTKFNGNPETVPAPEKSTFTTSVNTLDSGLAALLACHPSPIRTLCPSKQFRPMPARRASKPPSQMHSRFAASPRSEVVL
ncbi:hypothetical protein BU17DRAFT_78879 [Hysterangium stoloniferum]|nr:hypothetical protein BU17DRAFT_78879 [Hysterangium stoloniferum]